MLVLVVFVGCLVVDSVIAGACRKDDVTFELMTGYVYSAPGDIMDTKQGVLELAECIKSCRQNSTCHAINFETGLCVMFAANEKQPGTLSKSQFPVFTLFAQKTCVRASGRCGRPWLFEVVRGHELRTYVRRRHRVASRRECMELCLKEKEFICRSANYQQLTGDCAVSDMDRFTVSGMNILAPVDGVDYLESNCVSDPIRMCDFTQLKHQLLKTVDTVHQDVASQEACRQLCLQEVDFRCHTFDYGDTGAEVCRLSHHSGASLQHIEEPYLDIRDATTYQLMSCYNVTIECRATDMVAHVTTNKVFNGKVYAKNRPNSCAQDVVNSLEFDLELGYHDLNCDVKQEAPGRFSTDIIIQHHDQIVTSSDVGLSVRCSYSLQNRSVGHGVELEVGSSQGPAATEESSYVVSPTVTMRITDRRGDDIHTAQVGDALSLRFHILDIDTPYQIFVRELIALDGVDSSEILLIDSLGCPTDPTIMGAITVVEGDSGAIVLQAPFDAFKFPTSDVVQFKALVTPCMPACEPKVCDTEDYYGMQRTVDSYGRRKREVKSRAAGKEEMLVVQSIRIEDKFQFDEAVMDADLVSSDADKSCTLCMRTPGVVLAGTVFICLQLLLALAWLMLCRRRSGRLDHCTDAPVNVPYRQPWRQADRHAY